MALPVLEPTWSVECVATLHRLGFRVEESTATCVTMASPGGRVVFLPRHTQLSPEELRVLLLFAGVKTLDFLLASGRYASGEFALGEAASGVTVGLPESRAHDVGDAPSTTGRREGGKVA